MATPVPSRLISSKRRTGLEYSPSQRILRRKPSVVDFGLVHAKGSGSTLLDTCWFDRATFPKTNPLNPYWRKGSLRNRDQRVLYLSSDSLHAHWLSTPGVIGSLPGVTILHFGRKPIDERRRILRLWEAIEDCLLLVSNDLDAHRRGVLLWKWWKWTISAASTNFAEAIRVWKESSRWIKIRALRAEVGTSGNTGDITYVEFPCPKVPVWGSLDRFAPDWWLTQVLEEGVRSKADLALVSYLTSTRGLPPGDSTSKDAAISEWKTATCAERTPAIPVLTDSEIKTLSDGVRARWGRNLLTERFVNAMHVSISNTACLEAARSQGGREKVMITTFRKYMSSKINWVGFDVFGRQLTITDERTLGQQLYQDIQHAWMEQVDDGEMVVPRFEGLSGPVGNQFIFVACLEGIRSGCLQSSVANDLRTLQVVGPPPISLETVQEPGYKSRVVTVAPWWLTVLLQPFGHGLKEYLSGIPTAAAGLRAAYQGYEFCKSLSKVPEAEWSQEFGIKQTDLKTATDFVDWEVGKSILRNFLPDGVKTPYSNFAIDLLLSARQVVTVSGKPEHGKVITKRGSLMGDPGTKGVLTLLSTFAEEYGFRHYCSVVLKHAFDDRWLPRVPWRVFANAGDDLTAVGHPTYLRGITIGHMRLFLEVSLEKNYISELGAFYCEEPIFVMNNPFLGDIGLFNDNNYRVHAHVDAIKVRLLSTESKLTETRDESNPVFGKAHMLSQKLSWLSPDEKELEGLIINRFAFRFRRYLPKDPRVRLPSSLGGVGIWSSQYTIEEINEILASCSDEHLSLMYKALDPEADFPREAAKVLTRVSSNKFARGYRFQELSLSDTIRELLDCNGDLFNDQVVAVDEQIFPYYPSGHMDELLLVCRPCVSWEEVNRLIPRKVGEKATFYAHRLQRDYELVTETEFDSRVENALRLQNLFREVDTSLGVMHSDFQTVKFANRYAALDADVKYIERGPFLERQVAQALVAQLMFGKTSSGMLPARSIPRWFFNMRYRLLSGGLELTRLPVVPKE